jgi:hypothetical protein
MEMENQQFEAGSGSMAWIASSRMGMGLVLDVSCIRLEDQEKVTEEEVLSRVGRDENWEWELKAYTARLAPESPNLSLPFEVYEALIAAVPGGVEYVWFGEGTKYEPRIPCGLVEKLPSIVVECDANMGKGEKEEVTVRAEQYTLKVDDRGSDSEEEDMCALLIERIGGVRGSREVGLGWSAFRGRKVVLDWDNELMGVER